MGDSFYWPLKSPNERQSEQKRVESIKKSNNINANNPLRFSRAQYVGAVIDIEQIECRWA